MKYLKELDSLRALALFCVVASHWLPGNRVVLAFETGAMGVNAFFVLSGFLITGILLHNRAEAEACGAGRGAIIKQFAIRRSLRIFPIYYLTIFVLYALGPATETHIRENFVYFLTYTANFYFYLNHGWDGMLSHLWSLAVEEQFYLLWPWVVVFVPRKWVLPAIVAFIAVGVAGGYAYAYDPDDPGGVGITLPHTCFDAFGLGALLALVVVWHKQHLAAVYHVLSSAAALGALLILVAVVLRQPSMPLPDRTVHAVIALWVIAYVVRQRELGQPTFSLLCNKTLVYLGKISYGMYLYHLPLEFDVKFLSVHVNRYLPAVALRHETYVLFVENYLLLIGVSALSWVLLERPALRLKRHFEYRASAPVGLVEPGRRPAGATV